MRNIPALAATAVFSLAASCDGELDEVNAVRRIINSSSVEAQVVIRNGIDTVNFVLASGDTTEFNGFCTYDERRFCNLGWEGNSESEVRFVTDSGVLVWRHDFSGDFPDAARGIGANPQFEKYGYEGETVNDVIIYTFRILDSDIPR